MNRIRFTDAKIQAEKPGNKRRIISGENGLGLRVTTKGKKSFIFQYRFHGIQKLLTIGNYPQISLQKANEKLNHAKQILLKDEDPGAQNIEQKKREKEAPTVTEFIEEFIEKHSKPNKKTWAEDQRVLLKEIAPVIGYRKMKDVRKREIISILDSMVARGVGAMANRTLNVVSKMFNFAESRDVIEISPCIRIPAPAKKIARDRVLKEAEIKQFWEALEISQMSQSNKWVLMLLLITLQRRGETVMAQRKEFDLKMKCWIIPAEKAKNGKAHLVPLNNLALEILQEMEIKNLNPDDYLFPSKVNEESIDPRATTRALKKVQKSIGLDRFTPHDLRRTAATMMTGLGVPRLTVSKLLNHQETSVTGIHYDLYEYVEEKRKACANWDRKLRNILFGEKAKVINIKG